MSPRVTPVTPLLAPLPADRRGGAPVEYAELTQPLPMRTREGSLSIGLSAETVEPPRAERWRKPHAHPSKRGTSGPRMDWRMCATGDEIRRGQPMLNLPSTKAQPRVAGVRNLQNDPSAWSSGPDQNWAWQAPLRAFPVRA
jgi:hypothetical protein